MSEDYNKTFTRARLQAGDDLRRNGQLSAAARLVGWEILSCVNRVSGFAYPSEEKIAARLGITDRTVRTAVKQLAAAGTMKVMRHGRHNVYFPAFIKQIEENISGNERSAKNPAHDPIPENFDANTGKKQHTTPEKNNPLTLLRKPGRTPSTEAAADKNAQRLKTFQRITNEIAEIIGWQCVTEMPADQFGDLVKRWPNVDADELFGLKQKYEPPVTAGGRRARAAGGSGE